MSKKFLDLNGLTTLVNKILDKLNNKFDKNQGVENAGKILSIDEKGEITTTFYQSDYEQNDDTKIDYIKNRPFYSYENSGDVLFDEDITLTTGTLSASYTFTSLRLTNGAKYLVQINNEVLTLECGTEMNLVGTPYHSTIGQSVKLTTNMIAIIMWASTSFHLKISTIDTTVVPIDEKYIPDTIPKITSATVGQLLTVKSVDENNKPTKWEVTDAPCGIVYSTIELFNDVYPYTSARNAYILSESEVTLDTDSIYAVTIDEDRYTNLTPTATDYGIIIGNGSMLDLMLEDTGDPFVILFAENVIMNISDRSDNCNIIVEIPNAQSIKQLDEKFIPDISKSVKNALVNSQTEWSEDDKKKARQTIGAISVDDVPQQVQSDWEQNDETAPDYIKNRTHYVYEGKVADEVLFDGDIDYSITSGMAYCAFPSPLPLTNGTEYLVQFNDTVITLVCGDTTVLDDNYSSTIGSSVTLAPNGITIWYYKFGVNLHLKISTIKIADIVVSIDDKYIPDTILRYEMEETLEWSDVEMTATDDGNGNVTVETTGMEITDDGNGNVRITSEHLTAVDNNSNITISV